MSGMYVPVTDRANDLDHAEPEYHPGEPEVRALGDALLDDMGDIVPGPTELPVGILDAA